MAELLVMARSNRHFDPEKDRRGCYKLGDIVLVMEDRHRWGREELRPPEQGGAFRIVKVPGVRKAELEAAFVRQYGTRPDGSHSKPGLQFPFRRRRLRIDLQPNDNTLTLDELHSRIVDKTTEK